MNVASDSLDTEPITRPWLDVRRRLALVFALCSTVGIALGAGLLFVALNRELNNAIDDGLRARADDLTAEIHTRDGPIGNRDPFAQVLTSDGTVVAWSPGDQAINAMIDVRSVDPARGDQMLERDVEPLGGASRLLVRSVATPAHRFVLVVGQPLDATHRAQTRLAALAALAGVGLAVASAAAGWWVAGAALRPVRELTDEVDAITSLNQLGHRLRVPAGSDDVTRLGHTLNATLARIDGAVRHERAFIDDASHELRTPIAIIQGELELARSAVDDPAEMRRVLDSALEETSRLRRLADTLLMLARSDAGQLAVHSSPFDVLDVARRSAEVLGTQVTPQIEVVGVPALAQGDPELTERILLNLIGNAQRFAVGSIQVRVEDAGAFVDVTVADDGQGFADSLLPIAFERFSQHGRHAGTGLGLAICASLAHAQHGSIDAGNGPPLGGAWVRVSIPRAASAAGLPSPEPAALGPPPARRGQLDRSRRR